MISLTSFDLIPTDWALKLFGYFPEDNPFSLNFETAGLESKLLLKNIGLIMYLIFCNILYGLLHCMIRPMRDRSSCLKKTTEKMENYLYFKGSMRFFMEVFFDVCLVASLNIQTASSIDQTTSFASESHSFALSIAFILIICLFPAVYIIISCIKPKKYWSN